MLHKVAKIPRDVTSRHLRAIDASYQLLNGRMGKVVEQRQLFELGLLRVLPEDSLVH
jgi:hypothetical protein